MKHMVQIGYQKFLLDAEQMSALVNMLADCEVHGQEYLGSSVPESRRWKQMVMPPKMDELKFGVMDTARYEALKLVGKLHAEEIASK